MTADGTAVRGCVVALLFAASGCSATTRAYGGDGEGGGASASTGGLPTSTTPASVSASQGVGGEGAGAQVGGGSPSSSVSSGGEGGGSPGPCGNGRVDVGEECDEVTGLCEDCQLDCPAGWLKSDGSCFGVAVGSQGTVPIDGLAAAARCGELDVLNTGHRAVPAAPRSGDQFLALAAACPNNGCWLGYLNLAPLGAASFISPATGDSVPENAPWTEAEMHVADVAAVCTILEDANTEPGVDQVTPALEAKGCLGLDAYFACELRPGVAPTTGCGNDVVGADEECESGATCSGCDRRCPTDWVEDPRTHACTTLLEGAVAWSDAAAACVATGVAGARLATPDDPEDVRVLQFTSGVPAWLGLQVGDGGPQWLSGESFDYPGGAWPLPGGLGAAGDVGHLDGGTVVVGPASVTRRPLCEAFDPG